MAIHAALWCLLLGLLTAGLVDASARLNTIADQQTTTGQLSSVQFTGNGSAPVYFMVASDDDAVVNASTVTITSLASPWTLNYHAGQPGYCTIFLQLLASDSTTALTTFNVTVNPLPTITSIPDQSVQVGTTSPQIPVTVGSGTAPLGFIQAHSLNQNVISNSAVFPLPGDGIHQHLVLSPMAVGTAVIQVTVTDAAGATVMTQFTLTATPASSTGTSSSSSSSSGGSGTGNTAVLVTMQFLLSSSAVNSSFIAAFFADLANTVGCDISQFHLVSVTTSSTPGASTPTTILTFYVSEAPGEPSPAQIFTSIQALTAAPGSTLYATGTGMFLDQNFAPQGTAGFVCSDKSFSKSGSCGASQQDELFGYPSIDVYIGIAVLAIVVLAIFIALLCCCCGEKQLNKNAKNADKYDTIEIHDPSRSDSKRGSRFPASDAGSGGGGGAGFGGV